MVINKVLQEIYEKLESYTRGGSGEWEFLTLDVEDQEAVLALESAIFGLQQKFYRDSNADDCDIATLIAGETHAL